MSERPIEFFRSRLPWFVLAAAVSAATIVAQYVRHWAGADTLLGWDSPAYVWQVQMIQRYGASQMVNIWQYPNLYVQALASLARISNNPFLSEQLLPFFLGIIWLALIAILAERAFRSVPLAGFAALATAVSPNYLRLMADLHRNVLSVVLTLAVLLVVSRMAHRGFRWKDTLLLTGMFLAILATQFETFAFATLAFIPTSWWFLRPRIRNPVLVAIGIAWLVMIASFPSQFFGYTTAIVPVEFLPPLLAFDFFLFAGFALLPVLLATSVFGLMLARRENNLLLGFFTLWSLILFAVATVVALGIVRIPATFALRALLLLPIGFLTAYAASGRWWKVVAGFRTPSKRVSLHNPKEHVAGDSARRSIFVGIVFLVVIGSVAHVTVDHYFTNYLDSGLLTRIESVATLTSKLGLDRPIFLFGGPVISWTVSLVRNNLGARIGEHFGYYGRLQDLSNLQPSLSTSPDPSYENQENRWSRTYFLELTGALTGPPGIYAHGAYVRSLADLEERPIVIVVPEFYNLDLPAGLVPYHVGEGIFVLPPGALSTLQQVAPGPLINTIIDGRTTTLQAQFVRLTFDTTLRAHVMLDFGQGHTSIAVPAYPSGWKFLELRQGIYRSFPELEPSRGDGALAQMGNDPSESLPSWNPLTSNLTLDRKDFREGNGSLRLSGRMDDYGNLPVRFVAVRNDILVPKSYLALWAKCEGDLSIRLTLHDENGLRRTLVPTANENLRCGSVWHRFVFDSHSFEFEEEGFQLGRLAFLDVFVSGVPSSNASFIIDDLVFDKPVSGSDPISRSRLLPGDRVTLLFSAEVTR